MSGKRRNSFESRESDKDHHQRYKRKYDYEEDDMKRSRMIYESRSNKRIDNCDRYRSRSNNFSDDTLYEKDLDALRGWKELDSYGYRRNLRGSSQEREYQGRETPENYYDRDRVFSQGDNEDSRNSEPPNETIMVRNLPLHINENDLGQSMVFHGLTPKSIRVIRRKDTGLSKGFAFIEFNSVEEAVKFMKVTQGYMILKDQYKAVLHYSIPRDSHSEQINPKKMDDWFCSKCSTLNFKRRDVCFRCFTSREDSVTESDDVSFHPTRTIMIRNLDPSTTEDSILLVINNVCNLPIKSIRIIQEPVDNRSQGVCYIDMNNVADARYLYSLLSKASPKIDGKKVNISYCKISTSTTPVTNNAATFKFDSSNQIDLSQYSLKDVPQLAQYSASLYATTPEEHSTYANYYTQYYESKLKKDDDSSIETATSSQSVKIQQDSPFPIEKNSTTNLIKPSDISTYTYDESSGYYYDSTSRLYYDANTQYYYNSQTGKFLLWDTEKQSFSVVDSTNESKSMANEDAKKKCKEKEKQNKVKTAKKIVKDMKRWTKTFNQKKDSSQLQVNVASSESNITLSKSVGSADAGYAILDKLERSLPNTLHGLLVPQSTTSVLNIVNQASSSSLVAPYKGESESDDEVEDVVQEEKHHTDWEKLICLLCKRQFPNKDVLLKHQKLSDLHKTNLNTWYCVRGLDPDDPKQRDKKYRDRARERRQKFGELTPPRSNHLKKKYLEAKSEAESILFEEPNKKGISTENIGNKLLQKMGWQEGMGLGKTNQGRVSIIEAEQRPANAGLGHSSTTYQRLPGDSYKDCVKKTMLARFKEISEKEGAS